MYCDLLYQKVYIYLIFFIQIYHNLFLVIFLFTNVELIPGFCHKLHANKFIFFLCSSARQIYRSNFGFKGTHIFSFVGQITFQETFTSWYTVPILLQCLFLHLTCFLKNTAGKMDEK